MAKRFVCGWRLLLGCALVLAVGLPVSFGPLAVAAQTPETNSIVDT